MTYKFIRPLVFIMMCVYANAFAWPADEFAQAISCNGNLVCVAYDNRIDLVDWSDMDKPRKKGCCVIEEIDGMRCKIDDVALKDKYAYVALKELGICIVNVEDPEKPKIINRMSYMHEDRQNARYEYSMKIVSDLMILARYDEKGNKIFFCYSLINPEIPVLQYINNDIIHRLCLPYAEWDNVDQFENQYMQLVDMGKMNHGYFVRTFKDKLVVNVFGIGMHSAILSLVDVDRDDDENPVTRSFDNDAVITMGTRLWLINLKDGSIVSTKNFANYVHVMGVAKKLILLGDESGNYIVLDKRLNQICRLPGLNKITECFTGDKYVLMRTENSHQDKQRKIGDAGLLGYAISATPERLKLPYEAWGEEMKWIFKFGDFYFGYKKEAEQANGVIEIADCRNYKDMRITNKIVGVNIGPKGIYCYSNRIYILDAGKNYIEKENWKVYYGIPKVIDIVNIDNPRIRGIYNGRQ